MLPFISLVNWGKYKHAQQIWIWLLLLDVYKDEVMIHPASLPAVETRIEKTNNINVKRNGQNKENKPFFPVHVKWRYYNVHHWWQFNRYSVYLMFNLIQREGNVLFETFYYTSPSFTRRTETSWTWLSFLHVTVVFLLSVHSCVPWFDRKVSWRVSVTLQGLEGWWPASRLWLERKLNILTTDVRNSGILKLYTMGLTKEFP